MAPEIPHIKKIVEGLVDHLKEYCAGRGCDVEFNMYTDLPEFETDFEPHGKMASVSVSYDLEDIRGQQPNPTMNVSYEFRAYRPSWNNAYVKGPELLFSDADDFQTTPDKNLELAKNASEVAVYADAYLRSVLDAPSKHGGMNRWEIPEITAP